MNDAPTRPEPCIARRREGTARDPEPWVEVYFDRMKWALCVNIEPALEVLRTVRQRHHLKVETANRDERDGMFVVLRFTPDARSAPECPPDPRHGCGSRLWPTRNSASNPSPFADNGRKRVENLAERWQ